MRHTRKTKDKRVEIGKGEGQRIEQEARKG
jgi:hypothetical protein